MESITQLKQKFDTLSSDLKNAWVVKESGVYENRGVLLLGIAAKSPQPLLGGEDPEKTGQALQLKARPNAQI